MSKDTDGWSDGWHTRASAGESLGVLHDSAVGVAKSTVKTITTGDSDSGSESKPDHWSDGCHASASPRESISALRDSVSTREGWLKIARVTGQVIGVATVGTASFLASMASQSSSDDHEEESKSDLGWGDFGDGYGYYGKDGNKFD
ncbi:MAG: hypothetical protein JJT87_12455 [Halomonas sp.]|nr:hypothetical protein [Halomonas sp.]MCC5902721.1 hypothetical protein [Halomonas sp.]